jgi:hypothetical protein
LELQGFKNSCQGTTGGLGCTNWFVSMSSLVTPMFGPRLLGIAPSASSNLYPSQVGPGDPFQWTSSRIYLLSTARILSWLWWIVSLRWPILLLVSSRSLQRKRLSWFWTRLFVYIDFLMRSCRTKALNLYPSFGSTSSSFLESRSGYLQHSTPRQMDKPNGRTKHLSNTSAAL